MLTNKSGTPASNFGWKHLISVCISLASWIAGARAGPMGRPDLDQFKKPIYTVEGDTFVRHDGDRYCNRPLYCNQIAAAVLGGDRPYLMFGSGNVRAGVFFVGLLRDGKLQWAQLASDITMNFRADQISWAARDINWGKTELKLTAVPAAEGSGMAIRAVVTGALPGDKITWLCGAAVREKESFLNRYDLTTGGRDDRLRQGFTPEDCAGNQIAIDNETWTVRPPKGKSSELSTGQCSAPATLKIVDSADWGDGEKLLNSTPGQWPICSGIVPVRENQPIFWSVRQSEDAALKCKPREDFDAGITRAQQIESRITIDTPDPWLNAAVPASSAVMDGVFRSGIYTHAGMRWGVPLLGWRTTFGATAYGWHDRVMIQAKKCIARQITQSDKTNPVADPATLLSSQAPSSRLFGVGRIDFHQPNHYDMQSQFFDQLLYAWRATGDPELEKLLKPSLDLHLNYIRDCFDPSGLGIYESYANSWPTDDQWYNGGGTSEETAYAYRAHHDALLIAQRAHDDEKVKFHQAALDRIRKGFFDLLWEAAHGHPGAYREQGGLKRLHESAWLYAIFCPIDAGVLDPQQAAQALNYTEWGLERMKMPYGGEQCWPSNWVPSIWSVREMWPGDNYHLALAYYQTGLADQGWSLLRGTFPQEMFFGPVPGDLGHPAGGTDFNDCASMFCRTVVEGLFGYSPDYPNHRVTITPAFPADWDHASITTPDMSEQFSRKGNTTDLAVSTTQPADLIVRMPVSTTNVQSVTVNGKTAAFELIPGFGLSIVEVTVTNASSAHVEVTTVDSLGTFPAVHVAANCGDIVYLKPPQGSIFNLSDPQGALLPNWVTEDNDVTATVAKNAGDHVVFALTDVGATRQWRLFKMHITDVAAEQAVDAKRVKEVPKNTKWNTIDLQPVFNGDIRTIYQQQYVSPRPNTCSLRLATDGYSTWQMVLDPKNKPPTIDLSRIDSLLNKQQQIVSTQGVPFAWQRGAKNIAFTSQWDNWPKNIRVPINQSGEALCFLVCGTTNPMEVQIANASIDVAYADGQTETIELIPPFNFWSLAPIQRTDYDYKKDFFALPSQPPAQMQLGNNCRAIVLNWRLRAGMRVDHVSLNALSQQSVIGMMGVTMMNPSGN